MKSGPALVMALVVGALLGSPILRAATAQEVVRLGEKRADAGAKAQRQIDKLDQGTRDMAADYAATLKIVDRLNSYNGLLERQIENQQQELAAIESSMQQVTLLERQILPLMLRMIESLSDFVRLDMPFLEDERAARLQSLGAMMERSDIVVAEKLRKVLEAYQIEAEYGRTIEAYHGTLRREGAGLEVEFLRIGRIALLYRTLDGSGLGAWDSTQGTWVELPDEPYRRHIKSGLQMARKQIAPDLLIVPLPAGAASP